MAPSISICTHTTSSLPRPHILYNVEVTWPNQSATIVQRRYSDFLALHSSLNVVEFSLPPKRILTTTFIPSAWLDNALISERKAGLATYLSSLFDSEYRDRAILLAFVAPNLQGPLSVFDIEDALPSTLSRKAALDLKTKALAPSGNVHAAASLIAAAYYPDWSVDSFPPENLDYSKFDILFFAFATPNSSSTLTWDSGSQSILQRLVSSARSSGTGTKIVLSVGGWGGSYWFSQACSSSANRATFVNSLSSAVSTYGLDGIDIDWEYPNSTGAGNPYSSSDSANFLSLLKSMRTALGSTKIISAAVPDLPWLGSNGNPLTNVSAYASQMTYLNIMNYDVNGSSSHPGPNAPLGDLCGTSSQPQASAQAAFSQWTSAGFPASKLLLGLPLYGYVSQSTDTALTGSLLPPNNHHSNGLLHGQHRRARSMNTAPPVKVESANANLTSWYGQQIPFSSIVSSGALVKNSNGTYGQGGGFTMAWDDCSDTPFLYNTSQQTVVTYDDTYSLGDKATFAKQNGMAGCFTWSLDQDDGVTLQDVIRSSLGK